MSISKAVNLLEDIGEAYYRPMGGIVSSGAPHLAFEEEVSVPNYSDMTTEHVKRAIRGFHDSNVDAFADGAWMYLSVVNDSLLIELGYEY